jgi:hypothetical protein
LVSIGAGGGTVSGFAGAGESHSHVTQEQPCDSAGTAVSDSQQTWVEQHVPQHAGAASANFCGTA